METRFDLWLSRINHLAQIGLLLLAGLGFWFTVRPLYQNAVLSESVAQKELQLHTLEHRYSETYSRGRASAVGWFVLGTGIQCSGLLAPPADRAHPDPMFAYLQATKVSDCLTAQFQGNEGLKLLSEADRAALQEALKSAGQYLDSLQETTLASGSAAEQLKFSSAMKYSGIIRSRVSTLNEIKWPIANDGQ